MDSQNQTPNQNPAPAVEAQNAPAEPTVAPVAAAPAQPTHKTSFKVPITVISTLIIVIFVAMVASVVLDLSVANGHSGYFPVISMLTIWLGLPAAGCLLVVDLILVILQVILKNK